MIDFNTTFRSRASFESFAAQSPQGFSVEEAFARLDRKPALPARTTDELLADWLTALDDHGVSHAVSLASRDEDIPLLAEVAQKSEGRLIPFAPFDPSTEGAIERAEHLLAATGFRGLVLDPARDGYLISEDRLADVFETIATHDGIVFMRSGVPNLALERAFGLPIKFDPNAANPLHLLVAAHRHPDLQFVIPNFGSGFFRELLLVGAECPNLRIDSSSPYGWMTAQNSPLSLVEVFESMLSVFGADRVLFGTGSDDPRSGWNHQALTLQREALGACGTTPEECDRLLGGNALQLLGLPVPRRRAVAHPS